MVIVEVPLKLIAGVSVRVESLMVATTFAEDEVAVKLRASLYVESDANKDTVLEVLIKVACSFITLTTGAILAAATELPVLEPLPLPQEDRKIDTKTNTK